MGSVSIDSLCVINARDDGVRQARANVSGLWLRECEGGCASSSDF